MNAISPDIMRSMVLASASLKQTQASMQVYQQASNEGEGAIMTQALQVMSKSIDQAKGSTQEVQNALAVQAEVSAPVSVDARLYTAQGSVASAAPAPRISVTA